MQGEQAAPERVAEVRCAGRPGFDSLPVPKLPACREENVLHNSGFGPPATQWSEPAFDPERPVRLGLDRHRPVNIYRDLPHRPLDRVSRLAVDAAPELLNERLEIALRRGRRQLQHTKRPHLLGLRHLGQESGRRPSAAFSVRIIVDSAVHGNRVRYE